MLKIINRLPRRKPSLTCLSTVAQPLEKPQTFRTNETSPSNHHRNQIGQFYKLDPAIKKQLFLHGGIPKTFELQTKTFTETCLMIREPAVDIMDCMKNMDYSKTPPRFVLWGKQGNGKSLTLVHLLHHAHETNHLIVHVPWVTQWFHFFRECSNSDVKEGFVDINLDAAAWLVHMKTQNQTLLSDPKMVTCNRYEWTKRESTEAGSTLLELIDHGINRVKYASRTVTALCKEIKELSKKGVCKTFVAIDCYNALFYPYTEVKTEKKERVPPWKITLCEGFYELTKADWNNAVIVLTVDQTAIKEENNLTHMPWSLLGVKGFEHLDPFIPVAVPEYSDKEFLSCMNYYRERKWVQSIPGMDEELQFLSASNPLTLMQLCDPL